jgi:hypothetical protein
MAIKTKSGGVAIPLTKSEKKTVSRRKSAGGSGG